jgi:hypothetical protein
MAMLFAYEFRLPPIRDGERGEYITSNLSSALDLTTLKLVFRISGLTYSGRVGESEKTRSNAAGGCALANYHVSLISACVNTHESRTTSVEASGRDRFSGHSVQR